MKRIIIGRGVDCDVVIPDETDNVSRHHAVITFSFLGKMRISDTSSNGTFINGNRMLKGTSMPVTRKDEIRFGEGWILDWNMIQLPNVTVRKAIPYVAVVLLLAVIGVGGWVFYSKSQKEEKTELLIQESANSTQQDSWNADSTKKVAPTEVSIDLGNKAKVSPKQVKVRKKIKKKKNAVIKEDMKNVKDENIDFKKENLSSEKNMPIVN